MKDGSTCKVRLPHRRRECLNALDHLNASSVARGLRPRPGVNHTTKQRGERETGAGSRHHRGDVFHHFIDTTKQSHALAIFQ